MVLAVSHSSLMVTATLVHDLPKKGARSDLRWASKSKQRGGRESSWTSSEDGRKEGGTGNYAKYAGFGARWWVCPAAVVVDAVFVRKGQSISHIIPSKRKGSHEKSAHLARVSWSL
jgi:hypothetical protein